MDNKRTSLTFTGLFVAKNGFWLAASQVEAAGMMSGLAASELSEIELADWLERSVVPLDRR